MTSHTTFFTHTRRQILLLGFIGLLGFLEVLGVTSPLRKAAEWALRPMVSMTAEVTYAVRQPFLALAQGFQRYQQVLDLELQYTAALAQLSQLEYLKQENEELRSSLGSTPSGTMRHVFVATILSYGQPTISLGSQDGLQGGEVVLVGQTVVGRVGQVSEYQSEVELLSANTPALILAKTESGATGIITGDGKYVRVIELPVDAEVRVGERVISVGQPGVEPGLFLGKVASVEKRPSSSTQVVQLDQVVSFFHSHMVEVHRQ